MFDWTVPPRSIVGLKVMGIASVVSDCLEVGLVVIVSIFDCTTSTCCLLGGLSCTFDFCISDGVKRFFVFSPSVFFSFTETG